MMTTWTQNARWTIWDRTERDLREKRPPESPGRDLSVLALLWASPYRVAKECPPALAPQAAECAALRAELTIAQLDVQFWKGEHAMVKSGLNEVRDLCAAGGIMSGALTGRVQRLIAERNDMKATLTSLVSEIECLKRDRDAWHQRAVHRAPSGLNEQGETVNDPAPTATVKTAQ